MSELEEILKYDPPSDELIKWQEEEKEKMKKNFSDEVKFLKSIDFDQFYYKLRDFYKQEYRDEWREEFNKIKPHYEIIKKFYEWATSSHYL